MKPHIWKGIVSYCVNCRCTSLEAQRLQPESNGVGPCPLQHDPLLAQRLLKEWADKQQAKTRAQPE